ncbi:MAG: threonine aldolase, partial [Bacteroidia bacterium]|nr:threonine aldolase [Bacteroidia bacterium]
VLAAINPPDFYHSPLTRLVAVENTTNKGGGACWDFFEIKKIGELCQSNNLGYHLDGARIWNALIAKDETANQYGHMFDSISVCFSKGLGSPVGSILIGDDDFMKDAIRIRKILGGGMRQVGYLAAAANFALDHNLERLKDDHEKAKEIGILLSDLPFIKTVEAVETNIVIFELNASVSEIDFMTALQNSNIHAIGMGGGKLRMVTHLDYTDAMHDHLLKVLEALIF